jgi:peptidylprolyl isomerase
MSEQVQTAERTPTAGESAANARRRGQAIAGAAAGAAVVAVLVAVFVGIQLSGNDDKPAASGAAASAPAAAGATPDAIEPSAAAPTSPPAAPQQPVKADPALQKPPTLKPGGGAKLTKLVIKPLIKGKGPTVKAGQTLTVNYLLGSFADGKKIESSWDSGQPVQFPIGVGQLIKGWDQGLPGQTVGSRVQLDVPAALAYGPDKGDLRFIVDILAAQ